MSPRMTTRQLSRTGGGLLVGLSLLTGCFSTEELDHAAQQPGSTQLQPAAPEANTVEGGAVPVQMQEEGNVSVVAVYEPERPRKRMDIDQLEAELMRVSNGLTWTDIKGTNQFVALSSTLGKPDYIQSTVEELGPTVLFEKFLGDAARSVCTRLVDADKKASPEARVLMREASPTDTLQTNPEGVDANLRRLLLRFHGRAYEPHASQLNQWSWLFETVSYSSKDPALAWRAVCVALISHPDFYSY